MSPLNRWAVGMATMLIGLCCLLCLPTVQAASGNSDERSRVIHAGLRVEFSARCMDHTVQLLGLIANETAKPIVIQGGSLPWQYDLLGSEFAAVVSGEKLKRNEAAPIFGRVGPITLAPHEHQEGSVPISTLFPELNVISLIIAPPKDRPLDV